VRKPSVPDSPPPHEGNVRMMTPRGSLSGAASPADEPVVIKVRDNGPYKITGPVVIVDADGNRFPVDEGRPVALCRCGHSRTKPFCDRSHREAGFDAGERAADGAERS